MRIFTESPRIAVVSAWTAGNNIFMDETKLATTGLSNAEAWRPNFTGELSNGTQVVIEKSYWHA
jgi:hypothetical protein